MLVSTPLYCRWSTMKSYQHYHTISDNSERERAYSFPLWSILFVLLCEKDGGEAVGYTAKIATNLWSELTLVKSAKYGGQWQNSFLILIYINNLFFYFILSTAADHCCRNPCANNGTCYNSLHGYHCSCPEGFTGSFCEEGKITQITGWTLEI